MHTLSRRDLFDQLCDAVDSARAAAADNARWLSAIDAAWGWLLEQETLDFDAATHELRVPSATTPGLVYTANGACQCSAFATSNACWHRAAARLVRRALERQRAAQVDADVLELYPPR